MITVQACSINRKKIFLSFKTYNANYQEW